MQFLVLAKAAKGAACVALIQQVLSNKKIFVFGELLAMPNVQAVSPWSGLVTILIRPEHSEKGGGEIIVYLVEVAWSTKGSEYG